MWQHLMRINSVVRVKCTKNAKFGTIYGTCIIVGNQEEGNCSCVDYIPSDKNSSGIKQPLLNSPVFPVNWGTNFEFSLGRHIVSGEEIASSPAP